jgi:predicted enzyme related to lactoylglutathione lyase
MSGRFVWYDLMTTDLAAATAFYDRVVGWNSRDAGMPGPTYMLFNRGELPVAGAMQLTDEMCSAGARPGWMGHVGVDDVDASAAKAVELGGRIHVPPQDIPGVGRFSIISDPQGAVVSLFQGLPTYPQAPRPPSEPGYPGWRELLATDWEAAFDFYSALFGWTKDQAVDLGPMGTYQLLNTGAPPAGGAMFNKPADIPAPFWMYYFYVESIGAGAERVKAGGGKVLMGPHEVPGGSWIVQCMDPQGAMFALVALNP